MFTIDLDRYNLIDISFLVRSGADPYRPFDMERDYLEDRSYKYNITNTHTHVGTHIESSSHFFDDGQTIDQYDLGAFHGRGILLDVDLDPGQPHITAEYVRSAVGDIIRDGDIVVCRSARPKAEIKHFTEDAALYLKQKNIKMFVLGDGISMGESIEEIRLFHEILMRDTTFLEILSNLDRITKREFYVMALPVLIKGLDSSWARAIVIEEK